MGFGYVLHRLCPEAILTALSPLYYRYFYYPRFYEDYFQWFDDTDEWDRERLLAYQWKAMKRLLEHASKNVPFYREKWKGIDVNDICGYEDLVDLPILSKQDVREYGDQLIAEGIRKKDLIMQQTGGSTGTPLQFYYDVNADMAIKASLRRWGKYAGMLKATEKFFYISRPAFALMNNKRRWGEHGERYYGDYFALIRRGLLATTNLTDDVMCRYCDLIEKHKPPFLKGYSSGLYLLAEYCVRTGRQLDFIKAVMASSDMVTPKQREMTLQAWNCEVFDHYGMNEEVATANECREHKGYHIDMVKCLVEILDDENQQVFDAPGKIVGTCLTNYAMPFIRYEVGDRASLTKDFCPCGRQSMMLAKLEGRQNDVIKTPAGRSINASVLGLMVIGIHSIKEIQFVQPGVDKLIVRIACSGTFKSSDEALFLKRLNQHIDNSISVQVNYVDSIPRQANGKFRLVVSEFRVKQ